MERRMILGIVAFAVAAIFFGTLVPGGSEQKRATDLPWQVTHLASGGIRVFGVSLGETTLSQVQDSFGNQAEISLFEGKGPRRYEVEAYFDHVTLGGLSGRFVLTMGLSDATLKAMFDRGARIATLGSGARKVTLSGDDLVRVLNTPVATLTYLPYINLDPARIEQHFGTPAQRISEKASGVNHWLYPKIGLDVALSAKGKEVFQYVPPGRFEALVVAPLTRPQPAVKGKRQL